MTDETVLQAEVVPKMQKNYHLQNTKFSEEKCSLKCLFLIFDEA